MLLTVQFPLADSRRFIPQDSGRLPLPQWPAAVADTDFVRGFGAIRRRGAGGLDGWVGESVVCEARKALRLPNSPRLLTLEYAGTNYYAWQQIVFRRLFADGFSVAKFEIGYYVQLTDPACPTGAIGTLLESILNAQVSIAVGVNSRKTVSLIQASKLMALSYQRSTTKATFRDDASSQPWWVTAGSPTVLIEHDFYERVRLPYPGKTLPFGGNSGSNLSLFHVPFNERQLAVWVLESIHPDKFAKSETRAFRICLLRLHAEREVLRSVLRHLATNRITVPNRVETAKIPPPTESLKISRDLQAAEDLQYYFNEATRRLTGLAKKADIITDTKFAQLAREASDALNPGEREALLLAVQNSEMRRSVSRKIEQFIINYNGPMSEYNISGGQQAAVGTGAIASANVFHQWNQSINGANLDTLGEQLGQLRSEMKKRGTQPEHDTAVGAIAEAETEAKKGDGPKAFASLKRAGSWALDVAKDLGVAVTVEALKQAAGM